MATVSGGLTALFAGCQSQSATPTATATEPDTTTDTTGTQTPTTAPDVRFLTALADREYETAAETLADSASQFVETTPVMAREPPEPARAIERWRNALTAQYGPIREVTSADENTALVLDRRRQPVETAVENGALTDVSFPSSYQRPEYAPETSPSVEELSITVGDDEQLNGVLTVPDDGSATCIVLVQGFGGQDADYTLGPNKPFRDLALGFAAEGVATLRYDKRSAIESVPPAEQSLETLVIDDAVAAVDHATGDDAFETVAVLGHSLGGELAPEIARRCASTPSVIVFDGYALSIPERATLTWEAAADTGWLLPAEQRALENRYELFSSPESLVADELYRGRTGSFWQELVEYSLADALGGIDTPVYVEQAATGLAPGRQSAEQWRSLLPQEQGEVVVREEHSHYLQRVTERYISAANWVLHNPVSGQPITAIAEWVANSAD